MEKEVSQYLIPDLSSIVMGYVRDPWKTDFDSCLRDLEWLGYITQKFGTIRMEAWGYFTNFLRPSHIQRRWIRLDWLSHRVRWELETFKQKNEKIKQWKC